MSNDHPQPSVLALRGVPGAGKSTLAIGLRARAEAAGRPTRIISRDEVRKALFAPCDWTDDEKTIAFTAMLKAAAYHLRRNRSIIFDGMAFTRASEVDAVRNVAQTFAAPALVVDCSIPLDLAEARVAAEARTRDPDLGREHGTDVVGIAAAQQEPVSIDITVDMTGSPDEVADRTFAAVWGPQASVSPEG